MLVICLALLAGFRLGRADDKEEKERRESLEKLLAEAERTMEKEEWAVERKQFIADLAKHLDKADRIDLLRINPRALPEGNPERKKELHGYEVLSEVRIDSKEQRKEAAAFLGKTLHWDDLRMAGCFNPRHGLRVVSGRRRLDFLICFECHRVMVFDGGKQIAELPTVDTDKKNTIERLLEEAQKKKEQK
jgi:hypothetical protein